MLSSNGTGASRTRGGRITRIDALIVSVLALLIVALFVDERHLLPAAAGRLDLSWSLLPLYAFRSVARMVVAYIVAVAFAMVAGYWAARSLRARRFILPALDILQSVPILGFFPVAVFFFVRLFHGSIAGLEAGAVFLIFTSQAWNLAFGVYEALTTIPQALIEAVDACGASESVRWRRLLLPACVQTLTYNSILSWAAGWYFLVASEIITVGAMSFTLPGLGSYIAQATDAGRYDLAIAGVGALTLVNVLLYLAVWSPLQFWSARFRYESSSGLEGGVEPVALSLIHNAPLLGRLWVRGVTGAERGLRVVGSTAVNVVERPATRWVATALALAVFVFIAWSVGISESNLGTGNLATQEVRNARTLGDALGIPRAVALSSLRLAVAYVVALAWTIPVAAWIGRWPARSTRVLPVVHVLASLPATAFFPLLIALVLRWHIDLEVMAVALLLTGMQWYLLFNLVAGARAMPEDLRELAAASGVKGWLYLRRFFLPVAMPSLITGSLTAWGGGWNALIISEYVTAGGKTYAVDGVGALLDRATYVSGDTHLVLLTILSLVIVVSLLNRYVWRRAYVYATNKYRLDG
jgi:NitT/TauT family transport system permease protein